MIGAARFTAACCFHAQRWLAPTLVYVVALAATFAAGGGPLANVSVDVAVIFPVTAWLTVAVLNDEDDDHAVITASIVGGMHRLRVAKLAVAATAGSVLAAGGLAFAYLRTTSSFTSSDLGAGIVADLAAVAGGVVLGAVCARPLVSRAGTALLVIALVTIADLVTPNAPLHSALVALGGHDPRWRVLAESAATTVVAALVLAGAALLPLATGLRAGENRSF